MSDKVKYYLRLDSIGVSINIFITFALYYICSFIPYDIIEIGLKIIIVGISTIINLVIAFFFLLYWWSDIKWTSCKNRARKIKKSIFG